MPLFNIVCTRCNAENEVLIRGSETPVCPACGAQEVEKLLSHFAPMAAAATAPEGCGASQCCMMRGGCQN